MGNSIHRPPKKLRELHITRQVSRFSRHYFSVVFLDIPYFMTWLDFSSDYLPIEKKISKIELDHFLRDFVYGLNRAQDSATPMSETQPWKLQNMSLYSSFFYFFFVLRRFVFKLQLRPFWSTILGASLDTIQKKIPSYGASTQFLIFFKFRTKSIFQTFVFFSFFIFEKPVF